MVTPGKPAKSRLRPGLANAASIWSSALAKLSGKQAEAAQLYVGHGRVMECVLEGCCSGIGQRLAG
jgi:hypothetical protein